MSSQSWELPKTSHQLSEVIGTEPIILSPRYAITFSSFRQPVFIQPGPLTIVRQLQTISSLFSMKGIESRRSQHVCLLYNFTFLLSFFLFLIAPLQISVLVKFNISTAPLFLCRGALKVQVL